MELLTRKQAAEYLNVTKSTLNAWASERRNNLPFVRVGTKIVRYRKSDLDDFIARNTVNAPAPELTTT